MRTLALCFLAMAACGQVAPPTSGPDGGDDAGDDPDAPAGPTALIATTPADGAGTVDVTAALELDFDGPVEPAQLQVAVFERDSARWVPLAAPTWDAAHDHVTLPFARALDYGARYRVEIAGLDADVPPLTFTTRIASERHRVGGGWRRDTTLDADGWPVLEDLYAAGPDAVLDTADDVLSSHLDRTFDDGLLTSFRSYSGPGGDGAWHTVDDVVSVSADVEYGDAGATITTFRLSGVLTLWQRTEYDAADRVHLIQTYRSAGPDGTWFTDDDGAAEHHDYDYAGAQTTEAYFSDPGADGIWNTADDPAPQTYVVSLDDAGRVVRRVLLSGTGAVVADGDDTYDATTGLLTGLTGRSTSGPDAIWFTPDDRISSYDVTTYDGAVRAEHQIWYCGADQTCSTPDDVLYERTTYAPSR